VKSPGGPWDRTYLHYFPPGVVFMVVFAFLVPAAYFLILYFLRHRLQVRWWCGCADGPRCFEACFQGMFGGCAAVLMDAVLWSLQTLIVIMAHSR
jgi:hypothetical protein